MDPFSISVGVVQIVGGCSQATVMIIRLINDIRTSDERIRGFYEEIVALKATYDGLKDCLESPVMVEAARTSNKTNDGRHLWAQVKIALDDSLHTIARVNQHLDKINKTSGIMKRARSQLEESLCKGELGRLRERIKFFNSTIGLPIQMVCVMLQLEQRNMNVETQRSLDRRFQQLEQTMKELIVSLSYQSDTSLRGETLIVGSTDSLGDTRGKDTYLTFARRILTTASAAASTRSSSTISPLQEPNPYLELRGNIPASPTSGDFMQRRRTIPEWISSANPEQFADQLNNALGNGNHSNTDVSTKGRSLGVPFKLASQYLKNGQDKAEKEDYESAEKNFRKALELLAKHDFGGRIAFQPAEVVLMLSESCLKQKKHEQAIELLLPVADGEANIFPASCKVLEGSAPARYQPDRLQSLAASHMLGQVYKDKGDFEEAKDHALKAFMDRTDELRENDEKTLESVQLLIDIYREMGDEEEAEAYEVFLHVDPDSKKTAESINTEPASDDHTVTPSISPPQSEAKVSLPDRAIPPRKPTSKWRNMLPGRSSANDLKHSPKPSTTDKTSFSRTTTLNTLAPDSPHTTPVPNLSTYTSPHLPPISHIASPSSDTASRRLSSRTDSWDSSPRPSLTTIPTSTSNNATSPAATDHRTTNSVALLEAPFATVASLCRDGKLDKAARVGLAFLEGYPSPSFIVRRDELRRNIREGKTSGGGGSRGLASTGKGYSAIHYFCELKTMECVEEVRMLVGAGVDVNAGCYRAGFNGGEVLTPLGLAIARGHERVCGVLLGAKGVRVDRRDGEGMVPLLAEGRRGLHGVVRMLLEGFGEGAVPPEFGGRGGEGAWRWPVTWYGDSVLHDAARQCDRELVGLLLGSGLGGSVNGQDRFGKTPLMYAVVKSDVANAEEKKKLCRERLEVVRMLIEAGADVNRIDVKGNTASAYAALEGDEQLKAAVGEARFELPVSAT